MSDLHAHVQFDMPIMQTNKSSRSGVVYERDRAGFSKGCVLGYAKTVQICLKDMPLYAKTVQVSHNDRPRSQTQAAWLDFWYLVSN